MLVKKSVATEIGPLIKSVAYTTENRRENTSRRVGEETEPES